MQCFQNSLRCQEYKGSKIGENKKTSFSRKSGLYGKWLKEPQESMDRCIVCHYIT